MHIMFAKFVKSMKSETRESTRLDTCVRVYKNTRNRLACEGSKGQSFDDIINVLIDKNRQESSTEVSIPKVIAGENGAEVVQ